MYIRRFDNYWRTSMPMYCAISVGYFRGMSWEEEGLITSGLSRIHVQGNEEDMKSMYVWKYFLLYFIKYSIYWVEGGGLV